MSIVIWEARRFPLLTRSNERISSSYISDLIQSYFYFDSRTCRDKFYLSERDKSGF